MVDRVTSGAVRTSQTPKGIEWLFAFCRYAVTRRPEVLIVALVCVEALVLIVFFGLSKWPVTGGDGPDYDGLATNLIHNFTFSKAHEPPYEASVFRTPGYPLFVAAVYLLTGGSFLGLRIAQYGLLAATAVLLYKLGVKFVNRSAALIGAVLCATYPPFVFEAAYHLTETLSTFLAVLFVWLLGRTPPLSNITSKRALAIGLVGGAGSLVRPSFGLLIAVPLAVLLWSFLKNPRRSLVLSASLVTFGYLVCVGPWAIRNAVLSHAFSPLGAAGGMSLFYSMEQYANKLSYRITVDEWATVIREYDGRTEAAALEASQTISESSGVSRTVLTELETDRSYVKDARQRLRGLTVWRLIRGIPVRIVYLWGPADTSPWATGTSFHRVVEAQFLFLMTAVLCGCYLVRTEMLGHWALLVIPLYLTAVHVVFHVEPRYSFPARTFLFIYAGVSLQRLGSELLRRGGARRLNESAG